MNCEEGYLVLDDDEYQKAISQLRMQVTAVFDFIKVDEKLPVRYMYWLGAYIPQAVEEIIRLAEDFGIRVRGVDKPISIEHIRRNCR